MIELRGMVIQGMREVVPKVQNMSKALGECQRKEETPTEWLERLRKSVRMYSGTDPASPIGKVLLKTQFVAKSWEDIQRKLKKIEG
ncbi:Gag polyprotein [Turdus rufiventris]|nr:Gag polyprotein [Turdus rufiventris]